MKFYGSEQGQALVELGLLLPILLMTVFYMADAALWVQKCMQIQAAASAGAAYGAVPGNAANHATMVQVANFDATGNVSGATGFTAVATDFYTCSPGGAVVTATTTCSTGAPFHYVKVTTSAAVSRLIGFPGIPTSQALNSIAIYRVEVTP